MIIREVELSNFGIYGGNESFDLTPVPLNGLSRPVVLFSGKNGVGKTTIVEAIRLCLYGPLSLGNRVSRMAYERYLAERIHKPSNPAQRPTSAKVGLVLNCVSVGQRQTYRIERKWDLVQNRVKEKVDIWIGQDRQKSTDFGDAAQKESFLRELMPLQAANVLFLDGERLQLLAEDGTVSNLLTDAVETLFGINLVKQLQRDLDVYLSRKSDNNSETSPQARLQELDRRAVDLESNRSDLRSKQQANRRAIASKKRALVNQEQQIASEGKWFAEQLNALRMTHQRLEAEIEIQHHQVQEMTSGLLPFAIAPEMCRRVATRLRLEEEYERAMASQQVLEEQLERIRDEVASPQFWADVGMAVNESATQEILLRLEAILRQSVTASDIDPAQVILRVSDQDRQMLLTWIGQSLTDVPQRFCQVVNRLSALETEFERIGKELDLIPADETLKPLVETLHQYTQELGGLQQIDQDLTEQIRHVEYELEQTGYELRRVRQQIAEKEYHNQRIQLATKTQLVLEEYVRELTREKIALLEKALTVRFNELCHKESLVETIRIDPESYSITLYRQGQPFEWAFLSAGEKQLLAVAITWALREVSGLPLPIIIDTPLARLDSDHRLSMVQDYFPRASHQVIVFATDTEIDEQMLSRLTPAISRIYQLDYDPDQSKTNLKEVVV
ncbi:MAG: DNA sulfur modification protein DndD [Chloroflexi bacterium]|nr:MAG: DNA sulfur modification protein DndD [Chloroflexota bacterium]RLC86283.1 MAG: DNA sulfur modification protein DndD [Chloroflexota bacterium]